MLAWENGRQAVDGDDDEDERNEQINKNINTNQILSFFSYCLFSYHSHTELNVN